MRKPSPARRGLPSRTTRSTRFLFFHLPDRFHEYGCDVEANFHGLAVGLAPGNHIVAAPAVARGAEHLAHQRAAAVGLTQPLVLGLHQRRRVLGLRYDGVLARLRQRVCSNEENRGQSPIQSERPSKCLTGSLARSIPSRQRALTAAIGLPEGSEASPCVWMPQFGQKRCLILCLLNV